MIGFVVRAWQISETGMAVIISNREMGRNKWGQTPFITTASKDQRGFGLGLAIALAVARKHHAELKIVANGSKGACVSFRFRADMDILQS